MSMARRISIAWCRGSPRRSYAGLGDPRRVAGSSASAWRRVRRADDRSRRGPDRSQTGGAAALTQVEATLRRHARDDADDAMPRAKTVALSS